MTTVTNIQKKMFPKLAQQNLKKHLKLGKKKLEKSNHKLYILVY